jgi:hypothetical protein
LKLSPRTIGELAEIICGASGRGGGYEWPNFPYRSSSYLTRFFRNCGLECVHDGSTRSYWVEQILDELNQGTASVAQLPPDSIIRVIQELMDAIDYERDGLNREEAIEDLNRILSRDGFEAYFDAAGKCYVRSIDEPFTSATLKIPPRPLSASELARRKEVEQFLETASEDEFIEQFLVPLFRQLGFLRVIPTGHRDRSLEFGKDIWMKYRLPTGHFIYFTAQVKRDKIDSAGRDLNRNISGILAQARMALDHPIFDPETNRKHLVDHVFIISANFITKPARMLLIEYLDKEARRHMIFMDRDELLDLGAITAIELPDESEEENIIPF